MSDTPRTDQAHSEHMGGESTAYNEYGIMLDLARQLERELNEANAGLESVRAHNRLMLVEQARLRDIITRASVAFFHDGPDGETAAKMLAVLNEADFAGQCVNETGKRTGTHQKAPTTTIK